MLFSSWRRWIILNALTNSGSSLAALVNALLNLLIPLKQADSSPVLGKERLWKNVEMNTKKKNFHS